MLCICERFNCMVLNSPFHVGKCSLCVFSVWTGQFLCVQWSCLLLLGKRKLFLLALSLQRHRHSGKIGVYNCSDQRFSSRKYLCRIASSVNALQSYEIPLWLGYDKFTIQLNVEGVVCTSLKMSDFKFQYVIGFRHSFYYKEFHFMFGT